MEKFVITEIPAFKLFLLLLAATIIIFFVELQQSTLVYFFIMSALVGIFLFIFTYRIPSYLTIVLAISFALNYRIVQERIPYSSAYIPPIKGVFQGEVEHIVRKGENWVNFIASGTFDNKFSGKLSQQRVFMSLSFADCEIVDRIIPSAQVSALIKASLPQKKQIDIEFDQRAYSLANDIDWFAEIRASDFALNGYNSKFKVYSYLARNAIQERIHELFNLNTAPIVIALLTGEKANISPETREIFAQSGTAHLLAVSGLHVGIISVIAWFLLSFVRPLSLKVTLFLILIWVFILLTGFPPSGIRAGIFASLYVLTKSVQRKSNSLNILGMTGLLILIANPNSIFSASFQMSFASVFGILIFYKEFRQSLNKIFRIKENMFSQFIVNSLALTLSAGLIVSPIVAYYFGIYSIVSPLANLVAVPLITLALVYSLIGVILSYLFLDLGQLFCNSAQFLIDLTEKTNRVATSLDFSYLTADYIVIHALIISMLIAYVLLSDNNRKLISRTLVSVLIIILSVQIIPKKETYLEKILIREDFVSYIKDEPGGYRFVFICDRRPGIYPRNDYYFHKFLNDYEGKIFLGYTGNCGINVADNLKKNRVIYDFEIDSDMLNLLNEVCNDNKDFVKRLKYHD